MRVNSLPRAPISPFYLEPTQSKHMRLIDLTVHIPATSRSRPVAQEAEHPARWKTLEFRIYSVFIFIIVLIMGWIPMTLSSRALAVRPSSGLRIQTKPNCAATHPNYPKFRHRLSRGWMFGRPVVSLESMLRSSLQYLSNLRIIVIASIVHSEIILFH